MNLVTAAVLIGRPAMAANPTTAACLAASESSLTLRDQHRLRDARAQLLICSAASCPGDIRDECIRRVGELNGAMPTMVFEAKDASGSDISAVKVTMDGAPLAERLEGTALSIDPGEHAFTFDTPGQPTVQKQFVIREGEKDRRERIMFGAAVAAVVPQLVRTAPQPTGSLSILSGASQGSGAQSTGDHWSAQKKVGAAFGAGGLAGLVTGVIFSLVYDSRASAFNNAGCDTAAVGNGAAGCQSRRDSVKTAEDLFIAGYASAAVLGSIGAYLFFSAPAETGPNVALQSRSFSFRCLPAGDLGVTCGGRF